MPPKKPVDIHARPLRPLLRPTQPKKKTLPPFFLTMKLRRDIERLLPLGHHQRLRLYFDTYGCIRCSRNDVLYGGNGICGVCLRTIEKRLRKVDKDLLARAPESPPDLQAIYLRPYRSARQLLADLVPKMDKRLTQKREQKSPSRIYMKWLT